MQSYISLITLGVHDLARATAFYEHGMHLPRFQPEHEGVAFFALGGTWLALYPWEALAVDAATPADGSGFRGVTLAHNVDSEATVDAVLAEALAAGASLAKPAAKAFWGGYSGYFRDTEGHLWEVAHNPFFTPGPTAK